MLGCFREALLLDRMEGLGVQEPTSQGTNKPATTFLIPFPSLRVLPGRTLCPTPFWLLCPPAFGLCQWTFCACTSDGKLPGDGEMDLVIETPNISLATQH